MQERCQNHNRTSKPEFTDTIADVWIACKPLLDVMLKGRR